MQLHPQQQQNPLETGEPGALDGLHAVFLQKANDNCKINNGSLVSKYSFSNPNNEDNVFSLFVDAAFNKETNIYTVGFHILDPSGLSWGGGGKRINPPGSILNAEVLAIEEGVTFWKMRSKSKIKILTDSVEAVHALRTSHDYNGVEENSIKRTRYLIDDPLVKSVFYRPRADNIKAHLAAKIASKSPHPHAWVGVDIFQSVGN